jgi:hypothetical protein
MKIPRVIIIAVTSLLFTFSTFAQTPVSLTPKNIEGFIDSVRDLQELSTKYGAEKIVNPDISGSGSMAGAASPFSTAIAQMQGQQAYDEMLAVIKRHGFSDLDQWGTIADRIMRAFAANSMKTGLPQMDEQMQQALEQIEKSNMTDAQKDAMRQMMQSSSQMMDIYADVPEADKAAVFPFMSDLETLGQQ